MAGRVGNSATRLEFLHYNTWLMRDTFQVADLVKAAGGLPQFVACMGLGAADILAFLLKKFGSSGLCDELFPPVISVCGVSANPVNNACKLIDSAADLAAFVIKELGYGVDKIFALFSIPLNVAVDLVFEMLGVVVPAEVYVVDKPDLDARLIEIGDQVFSYDLAALCEVWQPNHKAELLSRGPAALSLWGPDEPGLGAWEHLGAGLLVFSPTFSISDGGTYTYKRAGVTRDTPGGCDFGRAVDADLWARKGIQRTLIDVGVGFVELYSTHLYNGGDMPGWLSSIFGGEPTDQEKSEIRAAQLTELAKFVADKHVASNVAMIVGDFNIPAAEMAGLINSLNPNSLNSITGLIFDDWYDLDMFAEIYPRKPPSGPGPHPESGHTNRGEKTPTFDSICSVFPQGKAAPPFGSQMANLVAPGDFFCDETIAPDPDPTGKRIDYILVQRPIADHPFNLDVSRIRRRAFKRDGKSEPEFFMSDHLGLEVTLFASSGP